jgi:hypothetical protein
MSIPRVYADFNALECVCEGSAAAEMALTGYGTLASLARQNIRLVEGMQLLFYEPGDVECEGVAHFDAKRSDPSGRIGAWVARIADHRSVRDCTETFEASNAHPCIVCGLDLMAQRTTLTRNYKETCVGCGASVMEPMAPPQNAT